MYQSSVTDTVSLESLYHLAAVSGAHFKQGTILIVILVSSGSAKSRTHLFSMGGFFVTRRGWPGRLRACRIWATKFWCQPGVSNWLCHAEPQDSEIVKKKSYIFVLECRSDANHVSIILYFLSFIK